MMSESLGSPSKDPLVLWFNVSGALLPAASPRMTHPT